MVLSKNVLNTMEKHVRNKEVFRRMEMIKKLLLAIKKKKKQLKLFWINNEKSRLGEANTQMEHQR